MLWSLGVKAECWLKKSVNLTQILHNSRKFSNNDAQIIIAVLNLYFYTEKRASSESVSFENIDVRLRLSRMFPENRLSYVKYQS